MPPDNDIPAGESPRRPEYLSKSRPVARSDYSSSLLRARVPRPISLANLLR
jgi:hypothetical protein